MLIYVNSYSFYQPNLNMTSKNLLNNLGEPQLDGSWLWEHCLFIFFWPLHSAVKTEKFHLFVVNELNI